MSKEKKSIAQNMGITRTVIRPREECDIQLREDRIGKYFKKYLNKFVFVEFSEDFMKKSKAGDLMRGVPIPLRKKEIKEFAGGEGIDMLVLAENMAWVMGCDPHFKYTKDYVAILKKLYNYKLYEGMMKEGRDAAERGDMDNACIHFRASLCMQYNYLHSMYSYARACRAMYLHSRNEEYVGRFKAESLDWFELLVETHPRFAQGYYYLGYAYLNLGLYAKADITWREFIRFSHNNKDKKEIRKRLDQITEPRQIEAGCNEITAGKYEDGISLLEPFLSSRFNDWWPLHYYLGVAYEMTGRRSEAVSAFRKVLQLNGSHLETMKELMSIYEDEGDRENTRKYREKIKLIEAAMEEEHQQHLEEIQEEDKKLEEEEPELMEPEHIDTGDADKMADAVPADAKDDTEETSEDLADADEEEVAEPKEKRKGLVKRFGKK
ncbi:MAG: tetratricopeptide repeat protein [Clostridia bacterium]